MHARDDPRNWPCVRYDDLCDGTPNCPDWSDEHPTFCMFFGAVRAAVIARESLRAPGRIAMAPSGLRTHLACALVLTVCGPNEHDGRVAKSGSRRLNESACAHRIRAIVEAFSKRRAKGNVSRSDVSSSAGRQKSGGLGSRKMTTIA